MKNGKKEAHPLGEKNSTTIIPRFNKNVKIDFTGETVTSNAGVLMLAELDHKLGIIADIASKLDDPRNPDFIRIRCTACSRSVCSP